MNDNIDLAGSFDTLKGTSGRNIKEYLEVYDEIHRMIDYRDKSEVSDARACYDQYINLTIKNANLSKLEREDLTEIWKELKLK